MMIAGKERSILLSHTFLTTLGRVALSGRRVWYSISHPIGFPWLGLRSCKDKADLPQDIFQPSYLISPR